MSRHSSNSAPFPASPLITNETTLHEQLENAFATIRELTARIHEMEAMERQDWGPDSKDHFHRIFLESSSPMLIVDPANGEIVDCNMAAARFYGYEQEAMRSMPIDTLNQLPPQHLDRAIIQARSRSRNHFFFRHKLASGELRDVEVYTGPISIQGRPLLYSIVHDITERRRAEEQLRLSEERLRMALEVSAIAVWDWDVAEDRMLRVVQQGSYAGINHEYLGISFQDFLDRTHPDDRDDLQQAIDRTVAEGAPYRVEYRLIAPHGQVHHMKSKAEPHFGPNGIVERVVGVTQNVTAERLAAEQLLKAKEEAEAANRSKSAFLANMSHEIRTPLSGVLGMLELMAMGDVPASFRELVENAITSGRNLKDLLSDILDLSKIEAGRMELEDSRFNLVELAANSMRMFEDRAHVRGLKLAVDTSGLEHGNVTLDPVRTRQILFNLVGNAVKFTDRGEVRLECCNLPAKGPYGDRVLLRICDTGVGIPEEMLTRIFEPFTQLDESQAKRFQGTGLGLSIVRRIVDLMNGDLEVQSQVKQGTDIFITLPVGQVCGVDDLECEQPDKAVPPPELPRLRILLAEDDAVNRLAAQRMLQRQGHEVHTVSDGTQVLDALMGSTFDCVLMDVQMPVVDGVEATRHIRWAEMRGELPHIPVVALTAYAMKGDRERFLEAGMDGYVAKPLDVKELTHVLGTLLARPHSTACIVPDE